MSVTNFPPTTYDPVAYSFFGWMGCAAALVFCNLGSAYGTAKSGIGIASMAVTRPTMVYKSLIPVVMAGILGIYGLIIAVIIQSKISYNATENFQETSMNPYAGFKLFAAGLCVGLSSVASGYAIGIIGDVGVMCNAQNEKMFVGMILVLIFAEAIGLFGLIISVMLTQV